MGAGLWPGDYDQRDVMEIKIMMIPVLVLQTIYKSETKYEEFILIQQEQIDLEFCLFEGPS